MLTSFADQDIVDGGTRYFALLQCFVTVSLQKDLIFLTEATDRNCRVAIINVIMERNLNETSAKLFRSMNTGFIEFKPLEFLTFRSTNYIDWLNNDETRYASPLSRSGDDEQDMSG
ncbi:MAG: hypothetical protein R2727_03270 [Bacteroidales bacterium]